ncbi:HDOD domain-containing protein [Thiovibrio sp. JS02]
MNTQIGRRLEHMEDFPTLPQSLQHVLGEIDAYESTADSLEKIIGEDPMLTARILRIANSAAYGVAHEISSVARAVMVLGFDEVRNLVVALSLTGAFAVDLSMDEFDLSQLWLHLVGTAKAAQMLAPHVPGLKADEMFTAGLIHDLGRVLACLYFREEMRAMGEACRREGITMLEAERRHELAHTEIGAFLTVKWGFGDLLASVVRYHHNPTAAGDHEQAASLIFLADGMAKKLGLGWSLSDGEERLLLPKCLALKGETIKEVARKLLEEKKNLIAGWSRILFT